MKSRLWPGALVPAAVHRYDALLMLPAFAPPAPKRAAIIQPHALFVPYLAATLRRGGLDVVGARPKMSSRRVASLAPDVVLLGIDDLPSPLSFIRRVRRMLPNARIVAYTQTADADWERLARSLGADEIVGPRDDEDELVLACAGSGPKRVNPKTD